MSTPLYDITGSNSSVYDERFTDAQGRRVYFYDDGRPYVHDKKGRRITRFKGAEDWSPFINNMSQATYRPKSNMITYEIKGIDANGNVIKSFDYKTEVFDIMDYKERPLPKHVQKDIRSNSFDYLLSKQIIRAQKEMNKDAENQLKEINRSRDFLREYGYLLEAPDAKEFLATFSEDYGVTYDELLEHKERVDKGVQYPTGFKIETHVDGRLVARHETSQGNVRLVQGLKANHYRMPTVFNPAGIRWTPWSLPDVLQNESLARFHRGSPDGDKQYLSLRGLGISSNKTIDKEAIQAMFGQKHGVYRIYNGEEEGKKYQRLRFSNVPEITYASKDGTKTFSETIAFSEGMDEDRKAQLVRQKREATRQKELEEHKKSELAKQRAKVDFLNRQAAEEPLKPLTGHERRVAEDQVLRGVIKDENNLAYDAVRKNIKEFEEVFYGPEHYTGLTLDTSSEVSSLAFDKHKLHLLYNEVKEFAITDPSLTKEEKDRLTLKRLKALEESDPKAYDKLLKTENKSSEESFFKSYRYAQKVYRFVDKRTPEQLAYDTAYNEARDKLDAEIAPKDIESYNLRRLDVTHDVLEYYGGYESYQKADKVYTSTQIQAALANKEIQLEPKKGYYVEMDNGERNYLQQTYNYKAESVWALLRSGSLHRNLDKNIHEFEDSEMQTKHTYDVATLEELEHDKIRLASEQERSLFVLTSVGEQKAEEAQKTALKVRQHNEVINQLLTATRDARRKKEKDKIVLTQHLQDVLGVQNESLTATQAYIHVSKFFDEAYEKGLTNIRFDEGGIQDGRAFDNLQGYLYTARKERHPVLNEIKRWNAVRKDVQIERNFLLKEYNVETSAAMAPSIVTSEEMRQQYQERLHLNELYEEGNKLSAVIDESTDALHRIKEGKEQTGDSGHRAKREIMDKIVQSRHSGTQEERRLQQAMRAAIANGEVGRAISRADFHTFRLNQIHKEGELLSTLDDPTLVRTTTSGEGAEGVASRKYSNQLYDMILGGINRDRHSVNLPPLQAFDVQSLQGRINMPSPIKKWRDAQAYTMENDAFYRRKDDLSLYNIKDVLDDGTVVAERVAVPAKAFKLELSFDDPETVRSRKEIGHEFEKTTDAMIPEKNKLAQATLSPDEVKRLEGARAAYVTKLADESSVSHVLSFSSLGEMLTDRLQTERYQANGQKFNNFINKRLMNITASRAGWMLREGMQNEMSANIWLSFYNAIEEHPTIQILDKNGINTFDKEFEDTFTKHLHKAYFSMNEGADPDDASRSLVRDVADFAKQYVGHDPSLSPEENHERLAGEVHRLITMETGDLIKNQHKHYNKVLSHRFVSDTILREEGTPQKVYIDDNAYIDGGGRRGHGPDDFEALDPTEEVTSTRTTEEIYDDQLRKDATLESPYDKQGRTKENVEDNVRYISEHDLRRHERKMANIRSIVDEIAKDGKTSETNENKLREALGHDFVDRLVSSTNTGKSKGTSDWDLFHQYYNYSLLPKYGGDGAYNLVQKLSAREEVVTKAVYKQGPDGIERTLEPGKIAATPLLGDGFWQSMHKEILTPTITSVDRLRSYVQLVETMPSLNMKATLDSETLRAFMPDTSVLGLLDGKHELSDVLPENDTFHLFIGKQKNQGMQGDLLARSNMTNMVLNITGTDHEGNMKRIMDAWSAFDEAPSQEGYVAKHPAMDGTHVASPSNTLPIAINPTYNANRINRSPSGVGFTSSSDVSTRAGLEAIINGKGAVGFDFETTGFIDSEFLRARDLVLPTEVFYRHGEMKNETFALGEGKHVFLNIGEQMDNRGIRVRDIVSKELASIKPTEMIQEVLGANAAPWEQLSESEQLKVMKSDKVSFLRNLAKYSDNLSESSLANVTNFSYRPTSFADEYTSLVSHAEQGINNIANGTVKAGAIYTDSLSEFMNIYNEQTRGKVLVAQNGADADLEWARHFAEKADVAIDKKPLMVEMMHLSRMLTPEAQRHSLEEQIKRSAIDGLYDEYKSGNHLADVDTDSMMRLFGEKYLPEAQEANLHQQEWLKSGQYMVRLGSTGSNKLPHDVYQVGTEMKSELQHEGGYRLRLLDMDGQQEVATIDTPSLQELQRNVSKNYKIFDSRDEAEKFLQDLTFDDAREDVSGAMLNYNDMVRERNRANGNGIDTGMQQLRASYDTLNKAIADGTTTIDDMSLLEQKIVQNAGIVNDEKMAKYGTPDYSARQRRAMAETSDFFASEDAQLRQEFLGEVDNLRAAGVVDDTAAGNLIQEYNERIKRRAAEVGRGPLEKEVPGLVNLGRVEGEHFVGAQGQQLTAMVNTYDQAERSLWEVAKVFKPLTDVQAQKENRWRGEALQYLASHLEQQGIMQPKPEPTDPKEILKASKLPKEQVRMEDIVDAVLTHYETSGNMKVADITQPLIAGSDDVEMREIFQTAHAEVLAEPMQQMSYRPDQQATYEATKAMRQDIETHGLAAYGFNYKTAGGYEGLHLKTTGDYAFRHADDLMNEIQSLNSMTVSNVDNREQINDLWREIYRRATDAGRWDEGSQQQIFYSDKEAAQHHLGWDSTPNQYVHPSETTNYPAGTKYYDMEEKHIRGILAGTERDPIRDRVQDYVNQAFGDNKVEKTFTHINPNQRKTMEGFIDALTYEAPEPDTEHFNQYVEEPDWQRPTDRNRPMAEIESFIDEAIEEASDLRKKMADYLPSKKAMGIVAAGAAAAYLVSQWSRGDSITPESRPQHDQAPDTNGDYQRNASSPPPQPQMQKKAYVQENGGLTINIQARNRNGVPQEQIDSAIQQGLGSKVTVHHQDDTSAVNSSWLQEKFTQLLDNGFVN